VNNQFDEQNKYHDDCLNFIGQAKKKLDELLPQFNELQQISQEFVKLLKSQSINPIDIFMP